ncbi:unnamed protein product [Tetraodon nigroviridis]|uniref:(spotted green pufferfish) hypothetical protein n=1 Tax=Tetraodon nigroviridis TaxID=99883 RepID=Q4SGD7_TETNG|nr:unnamed protein product [Tetraodon nigroviridis]
MGMGYPEPDGVFCFALLGSTRHTGRGCARGLPDSERLHTASDEDVWAKELHADDRADLAGCSRKWFAHGAPGKLMPGHTGQQPSVSHPGPGPRDRGQQLARWNVWMELRYALGRKVGQDYFCWLVPSEACVACVHICVCVCDEAWERVGMQTG